MNMCKQLLDGSLSTQRGISALYLIGSSSSRYGLVKCASVLTPLLMYIALLKELGT